DFDRIVTAPLHGFRDVEHYWDTASVVRLLHDIIVPTLVLNTLNDPFMPARHLPEAAAPCVTLEQPAQGGHLGFTTGGLPGDQSWLPKRLVGFFSEHMT